MTASRNDAWCSRCLTARKRVAPFQRVLGRRQGLLIGHAERHARLQRRASHPEMKVGSMAW